MQKIIIIIAIALSLFAAGLCAGLAVRAGTVDALRVTAAKYQTAFDGITNRARKLENRIDILTIGLSNAQKSITGSRSEIAGAISTVDSLTNQLNDAQNHTDRASEIARKLAGYF